MKEKKLLVIFQQSPCTTVNENKKRKRYTSESGCSLGRFLSLSRFVLLVLFIHFFLSLKKFGQFSVFMHNSFSTVFFLFFFISTLSLSHSLTHNSHMVLLFLVFLLVEDELAMHIVNAWCNDNKLKVMLQRILGKLKMIPITFATKCYKFLISLSLYIHIFSFFCSSQTGCRK